MTDIPDIEFSEVPEEEGIQYTVMVVDDSAFIRGAIARAIGSDPSLIILSSVSNGEQAIKALDRTPVDVIVLDIEMPVMDGLTALPKLKNIDTAVQVIMASTLTQKNAEVSLKAMSLGATDYLPKPSSGHAIGNAEDFQRELVSKIKALGMLARRLGVRPTNPSDLKETKTPPTSTALPRPSISAARPASLSPAACASKNKPSQLAIFADQKEVKLRSEPIKTPDIIAIGSSTGGPQALFQIVRDMGSNLPQPIVITQHMPPAFTTILSEHITKQCNVECREAKDGEKLVPGCYYVAPGDYHMTFKGTKRSLSVSLTKAPPENFCRPSVDPMLRSLATIQGLNVLTSILTGMGIDGTLGCQEIIKTGGSVVAQDKETSIVWGMPGSVAVAGLCSAILPITEIGKFVRKAALGARS